MKPIFTIHAGEYLVGSYVEQHLKDPKGARVNVWIPSKDTGIDFLLTDKENKNTTSIQVKFSRDFLITDGTALHQERLLSCGWWTLNREKIESSNADYWVLVVHTFNAKNMQYIIISPKELLKRMNKIHPDVNKLQTYLWVTQKNQCWEMRGLKRKEQDSIVIGESALSIERDFSKFLNNWSPLFEKWV
ncbi:hypothetical protein ABMX64_22240 [Vibrio vulnificus]|uniref:hypothetical protein n=1 Tax=Vibrio vulnificus TaxID=672 RepID=UPI0040596F1C